MINVRARCFIIIGLLLVASSLALATGYCQSSEKSTSIPLSLQQKMEQVQARVPQWVAEGGHHSDIVPLGEQVDSYLNSGQYEQAEAVVDRILAIINKTPTPIGLQAQNSENLIQEAQGLPAESRAAMGLITPAPNLPKDAAPGLQAFLDSMNLCVANGANIYGFAVDWGKLEPAPKMYNLQELVLNPLTLVVPHYPEVKAVVVVMNMIDSNRRSMPADLNDKAFDDPQVLSRFDAVMDAIIAEPSAKRITHLLFGNEVDSYLGAHLQELPAFRIFYQHVVRHIHSKLPGVRVGTILTSDVLARPAIFDALVPFSDFVDYTYYPVVGSRLGDGFFHWQMRPVAEVAGDLQSMAQRAGSKPFSFTEIGYSASALNGSSEDQQAAFVHEVFRILGPYRKQGRIEFVMYHALYDYAPDICKPYAQAQGIQDPAELCSFVENLGLRRYETDSPRKAWAVFVQETKLWQSTK